MGINIHQPHDKFFKRNLKEKKIAIDFLKKNLSLEIYQKMDMNTLQLTEKSFILPELREIHSDIIYKCLINNHQSYFYFLMEHQSTPDPLMAFRVQETTTALGKDHFRQGHKTLPIILSFCIFHGEKVYPYSTNIYDLYDDPAFARKVMQNPFKLIDLAALSDEEIKTHGLVSLMEMLFKHQRDKNFLSTMRKWLQSQFIQNIVKQLDTSYFKDMLNYLLSTTRDESEPKAAQHLIKTLLQAFPEKPARNTIMTFAEQLKEEYKQEFMGTLAQQLKQEGLEQGREEGREEGEHHKALIIARNMLTNDMSPKAVQKLTGLSKKEVMDLVNTH